MGFGWQEIDKTLDLSYIRVAGLHRGCKPAVLFDPPNFRPRTMTHIYVYTQQYVRFTLSTKITQRSLSCGLCRQVVLRCISTTEVVYRQGYSGLSRQVVPVWRCMVYRCISLHEKVIQS